MCKNDNALHKLIFVYNAESGLGNILLDGAHKILSPSTYDCRLCSLTFGAFTEKSDWKKFREESPLEMVFLHKDEFDKAYASTLGSKLTFPIVLSKTDHGLKTYITTAELNNLTDTEELIRLINSKA